MREQYEEALSRKDEEKVVEIEHYKKYIDACNEEIIEMKHLNEALGSELSDTKERTGQLSDANALL